MSNVSSTAERPRPVTYSLATGGYFVAVICILLAEYQALGRSAVLAWWCTVLASLIVLAQWKGLYDFRNKITLALVLSLVGAGLLMPTCSLPTWSAREGNCGDAIKQLSRAVRMYEEEHGTFPPTSLAAADGSAGLSWRVPCLNYLGYGALLERCHLDEPWDSPRNAPLVNASLPMYRCPAELNMRANDTSYVAITGDDTCWPSAGPIQSKDILDGGSRTILLAETHDSGIPWPEPRDLPAAKLDWRIHGATGNSISSSHGPTTDYFDGSRQLRHRTTVNVAMADGSVTRLSPNVDPEVLKQMVNRRDGRPAELP